MHHRSGRPLPFCSVLLAAMLVVDVSPVPAAEPLRQATSFRGLKSGSEFIVLAASTRRTDITIDGQPDVTTETSESLQIQYRIVGLERNGDLIVRTSVGKLDHQPSSPILRRLSVAPVLLRIQPDGKVRLLTPESRDALLMNLSNGDPESAQVLKMCLTDETIAAWFSVPFWMMRSTDDDECQAAWERSHDVSLGTLGSLQLDLQFRTGEISNMARAVAITGAARFRPLVLPDAEPVVFPFLSNASVEIDEISGFGRISEPSPDGEEAPEQQPEFDSVQLTLELHGDANLATKPANSVTVSNSDDAGATQPGGQGNIGKVSFRQTQKHVWTLQSFSTGMPRMFNNDRMAIPLP